jgi:antitoxin VapB
MSINIKNERVSKLAIALAEQTGESITDAVGNAIEEKLQRITKKKSREGLADKMRAIADDIASRTTDEWRNWDWEADLYDEQTGLPK